MAKVKNRSAGSRVFNAINYTFFAQIGRAHV